MFMFFGRKMPLVVMMAFLLFGPLTLVSSQAADPAQILAQIDDILKANPLKPDQKMQSIPIAQDDTISFAVLRATPGAVLKPHFHKTHNEAVYVIKGSGQMLIDGKWLDFKPGSIHFNPMNKIHSTKIMGDEPCVVLSIFTPAMKEDDRHYVE
jgi:quercetin dioxygenase-like cupin family protein